MLASAWFRFGSLLAAAGLFAAAATPAMGREPRAYGERLVAQYRLPPLAAGQALTLTASSAHVSFRGERSVAPMLGLVQLRNLDISDVQLQVWSGAAPQAWPELPWSRTILLTLGVACALIGLGYKYRGPAMPAAERQPVRSRGPAPEPTVMLAEIARVEVVAADDAPAAPPPPPPSPEARVIAALYQVLTSGLAVPTVLDEERMRKRRASADDGGAARPPA